jgi:hypothetical protein
MKIDGILLQTKEYKPFNSEYQTGLTPADDYFRNYGIIAPNGAVPDARDFTMMKNIGIMYQHRLKVELLVTVSVHGLMVVVLSMQQTVQ